MSEVTNQIKNIESHVTVNNIERNDVTPMTTVDYTQEHYVGVMFESKYNSSISNPKFYGKVYEYKTKKPLKEGEVITIVTDYGLSRVCVVNDFIKPEDLTYYDVEHIKEI